MESSGNKDGSMEVMPVYSPFRFLRKIFLITFLVPRMRGERKGASVTHSGGRMSRACLDSRRA